MDYRSIIESKYNRESWLGLLHDIFRKGASFMATPISVDSHSELVAKSLQLGTITLNDDNKIAVYEVRLAEHVDIVANRVGIRNLLISDWKLKGCVGAFMFCFKEDESVLRFSYVSETWSFGDDGKMQKESTDTKRFTYLLGAGHRSRTAIGQFEKLRDSGLTLKDLTKAFSIEALSDRFFTEYKGIYEDIIEAVTGKRMIKVANKWEERATPGAGDPVILQAFSIFDEPEKAIRDYVKNLMGRIVFLQFLQKKGWLGVPADMEWGDGDKEFIQNLYDRCADKTTFIDDVLEVLFDDINTKRDNDIASELLGKNIRIPYLNGGLFEHDQADALPFKLKREILDKMFSFFGNYNFTIDENDPDDAEIGVDPEMLGRIFENLLEDNKDKGAFYTPKEIVQYMCKESLIAYLQTDKGEDEKDAVRKFVTTYDVEALNEGLKKDVDQKLKDVKICDPAIGSGAFPMGLLKELFECRSAIEGLAEDNAAEIKKHIIQNNIYGVDIEKGAVDIARLRFWLALIVDEKTPHALPNMDFKIMQGNSLLESYEGIDLSGLMDQEDEKEEEPARNLWGEIEDGQLHLTFKKKGSAKKLREYIDEYYSIEDHDKKKDLLDRIQSIVREQIAYNAELHISKAQLKVESINEQIANARVVTKRLEKALDAAQSELNRYTTIKESADNLSVINHEFFLWHTWFSDVFSKDNGFDIVIGNPPYIALQNNGGELGKLYEPCGFSSFASTGDIYCLFYEKGLLLLKQNGLLSFITSNGWMKSSYGAPLRSLLCKSYQPRRIIDFAGYKVFEAATVDVNILFVENHEPVEKTLACTIDKTDFRLNKLSDYVQTHSVQLDYSSSMESSTPWTIMSELERGIKEKIEAIGTPLKDWDIRINFGIKTGYNEAFIITGETRNTILSMCLSQEERDKTAAIIRPILRGRDIARYGYIWSGLWVINTHNGIKDSLERIHIEEYPALKHHLDCYWERIESRADQGDTPYNLRNCAYLDEFLKPKIMWKRIGSIIRFSYDSNGLLGLDSTCFATGHDIAYLCCVLNSAMGHYLLSNAPRTGTGDLLISVQAVEPLRIPKISEDARKQYERIVSSIHGEPDMETEEWINNSIFDLYGLSSEERSYIYNKYK